MNTKQAKPTTARVGLLQEWPTLKIAGAYSPPFRPLSAEEDAATVKLINDSGTVWVSLGSPKQELWMAKQRGRINAVMIGVGAAFDYHAGTLRRAPLWMRKKARLGMVLPPGHRATPAIAALPDLITNTTFIAGAARQLLGGGALPYTNRSGRQNGKLNRADRGASKHQQFLAAN